MSSKFCWNDDETKAYQDSNNVISDSTRKTVNKNNAHVMRGNSGIVSAQNVLLRRALANRMTNASKRSTPAIKTNLVTECASSNDAAIKQDCAKIVIAGKLPVVAKRIVDYEVPPPDPVSQLNPVPINNSQKNTRATADLANQIQKGISNKMKNTRNKVKNDGTDATSLLVNAAWYRDIDGRTGYVPSEWQSVPNVQTSSVKQQEFFAETQSDNSCHASSFKTYEFMDTTQMSGNKFSTVAGSSAETQHTIKSPIDGEGGSSTSEVSRNSHKNVTFATQVTEICQSLNADEELQSLLHALQFCTNKNLSNINAEKQKNLTSACQFNTPLLTTSKPPRPPPRSPKNVRYSRNMSNDARHSKRSIIRSASGYLDDNSVIVLHYKTDDITDDNESNNHAVIQSNVFGTNDVNQQSSRSMQDPQTSYYDNISPTHPLSSAIFEKKASVSNVRTQKFRKALRDGVSDEDDEHPQKLYKSRASKLKGRKTSTENRRDNIIMNPLLKRLMVDENERRDSMVDSDSRESVLSATSLRAEKRVRRYFDY